MVPRIDPAGVAGPERGGKTGVRFKLFSLGAIEGLLGPAVDAAGAAGAAAGLGITLNDREGEAGTGTSADCLDVDELLDAEGVSTEGASALDSGTAGGYGSLLVLVSLEARLKPHLLDLSFVSLLLAAAAAAAVVAAAAAAPPAARGATEASLLAVAGLEAE